MPTFIVGAKGSEFGERDFIFTSAPRASAAETAYISSAAQGREFTDYVRERSMNTSFAARFWYPDETDDQEAVPEDEFRRNVYRYFGSEHQAWAEAFILGWAENGEYMTAKFPPEMLAFMWTNSNWEEVVAFPVEVAQ